MNEHPADSEQAAPASQSGRAEPAGTAARPTTKSRGTLLPVVLGMTALLVSGWIWWQDRQQAPALAGTDAQVAAQQNTLLELRGQLTAQQEEFQRQQALLQAELAAVTARSAAQEQQLAALLRRVEEEEETVTIGSRELLLAEAEGLLRLGRERLLVARDVTTAIRLYLAADELLRRLDDSGAFGIRETLAREIDTLRTLPLVDVQGLHARLGALSERIDGMGVRSDGSADFSVDAPASVAPAAAGWYAELSATLQRYFVVTRQDANVQPLLTTEQEFLFRRGIQLQLEEARLALLRNDSALWQAALDEAIAGSTRWLVEDVARAGLLAELDTLRTTAITVDIPVSDNALRAVQQVLQAAPGTVP